MQLRPYQQQAVAEIRQGYKARIRSQLFVLPTGGGKTYTFSYITGGASKKGNPVCILEHRRELIAQASLSLAELGISHGLICADKDKKAILEQHHTEFGRSFLNENSLVWVASVQTLGRPTRLNKFAHLFKLLIVDEAHHATAGQWNKIIEESHNARILGVTATPCRSDGQGLGVHAGGIFQRLVMGPTKGELIELGSLVGSEVYAPPVSGFDQSKLKKGRNGDWTKKSMAEAMGGAVVGDLVKHYREYSHGKTAIGFAPSVQAAYEFAAAFKKAGYRSEAIEGATDDVVRRNMIKGLGNGSMDVLWSCDTISEGTDIPSVNTAIMARSTQSLSLFLQQAGRVSRPSPGKGKALILDHVGNFFMHGHPDEDREWSLDGVEKSGYSNGTGGDIQVHQCPKCYRAHTPAASCPGCGHVYVGDAILPKQVAGNLQKVSKEEIARMRRQKQNEVKQARSREELEAIAKERGYKRGWVDHMLEARGALA